MPVGVDDSVISHNLLPFVIPAQAGIQVFGLAAHVMKMDAGLRRHDKSLGLKATDLEHAENRR